MFIFFFANGCRRRNLFFLVTNCQDDDKNQLVRRLTLDLNIYSSHGQPARCPARPPSIYEAFEDFRWIHGSRGRELAGGVRRHPPKPEKTSLFFAIRDFWRICVIFFCAHQRPSVVFIIRLASSRHMTPASV